MSVYRVTDIIGTSQKNWEDAARQALAAAASTLRDLRVAEAGTSGGRQRLLPDRFYLAQGAYP